MNCPRLLTDYFVPLRLDEADDEPTQEHHDPAAVVIDLANEDLDET